MKKYILGKEYEFKNGIVYKDGNSLGKRKRELVLFHLRWLAIYGNDLEIAGMQDFYEEKRQLSLNRFPLVSHPGARAHIGAIL